jgi:Cu-processing system permease protein
LAQSSDFANQYILPLVQTVVLLISSHLIMKRASL